MFRFNVYRLEKLSYATLFQHNYVLQKVFSAPAQRVALVVEMPSLPAKTYTYGQLQEDVIALSDALVSRKMMLSNKLGDKKEHQACPFSRWSQPPRDPKVKSVYAQGSDFTPSCDVLKDTGSYVTALLASPGYEFVVALLASWAINLLVTPMSVSQTYKEELTYVLEHSGARMVLGDTAQLRAKFPFNVYDPVWISDAEGWTAKWAATSAASGMFSVDSVVELNSAVMTGLRGDMSKKQAGCRHGPAGMGHSSSLRVEEEADHASRVKMEEAEAAAIRTAEDVEGRLEALKAKRSREEVDRKVDQMEREFAASMRRTAEAADEPPLQFNTETASSTLNPLFLRWYEQPSTRPTVRDDCLMIYTSGTTAKPKGSVHTHASIQNQVKSLQDAWGWTSEDSILHVLPLHHIHGLVNVLLCSLSSQARCVFTKFDANVVPQRIERGDITLVMAVPTVYTKMIAAIQKNFSPVEKKGFRAACMERVRLMVSGSAALPVPTLEQFRELSGHTLLERYGMTEIGMGLSQPLRPVEGRIPGTVGSPLPLVEAWVQEAVAADAPLPEKDATKEFDSVGALAIASESLFDRYWRNPEATRKELRIHPETGKRYFDTGDTVGVRHTPQGTAVYTILGRSSIDIIKYSGYKLSALEIEAALLSRKDLFYEMAVVGVKDEVYGEVVVAIIAMQPAAAAARGLVFDALCTSVETKALNEEMKKIAADHLAPYKRPSRYIFVPEIPRNPTGKVNKKNLKQLLGLP